MYSNFNRNKLTGEDVFKNINANKILPAGYTIRTAELNYE